MERDEGTVTSISRSIKRLVLGLITCGVVALGAPAVNPMVASAHTAASHPSYYSCSKYYSNYWGYSYGFYRGSDITDRLSSHDGYDGYDYGSLSYKWYLGYYPDDQYWFFYNYQPKYIYKYYNSYKYRCFDPYQASQGSSSGSSGGY
jgi:hypothetical protein